MADDLVFYTNPMSRGRIVRWMLEELGRPYRTELLEFKASMKEPAYLAVNPMGKVPAIRHGEVVVTEGAAICAYLADAFPEAGLAPPPGDKRRAAYYRWMFYAAGPLEAAVTNKALGFEVPPERTALAGYGCMADVIGTLEHAVSQTEYVAGDTFTAADVFFGSGIGWGMAFGTLETRPVLQAYFDRLKNRPAAVRARAIDDGLLAPDMRQKNQS